MSDEDPYALWNRRAPSGQAPSGPPPVPDDYEANYGAAAISGVRNAAAGMAGIGDLAAMGVDWAWGDDPVEGLGWYDKTRTAFDPLLPEPGWEPKTTGERYLSAGTEAAATFLVPGSAGLGTMRAIPQAVRAGRAFGGRAALQQYGMGAVKNYGRNAAALGASNLAGSSAAQYAQANIDPNNTAAQIGLPAAAAMIANPAMGMARSIPGRHRARQAAQAAVPNAKRGSAFKPIDRMIGMLRRRADTGEITRHDVIVARDHLHKVLMGETEMLTEIDIKNALESGDEVLANRLRATMTVQNDIMDTLRESARLGEAGVAQPTTAGVLGGAGIESEQLQHLGKILSAKKPGFARSAADVNKMAREVVADEATSLSPRGRGVDVQGTPSAVREVFDETAAAAEELAGDPWATGLIDDILSETPGIRPSDVRRVINNVARDKRLSRVDIDSIDAEDIMERLANYASSDGKVSAKEFRSVVRQLKNELAAKADVPKDVAGFRQEVYERMNEQLIKRFTPANRRKYQSAMEDYSEMKRTYDPELTRVEKRQNVPARILESKVAKALSTPKELADEKQAGIYTVRELMKISAEPEDIANQIRKVFDGNPQGLDEVEQQIYRALLTDVVDTQSTSAALKKAGRVNEGLIDLEGEGKLIALYRSIAGDEYADAAEELVRRGRQARYDNAGTSGKASATGSGQQQVMDRMEVGEAVAEGRIGSSIWHILKRVAGAEVSDIAIAQTVEEGLLNPVEMLAILDLPSGAVFDEWMERLAQKSGQSAARETAKRTRPDKE